MSADPSPSAAPAAGRSPMLSRVAHSLYWMSLYVERAENLSRLLDVNLQFLLDFQGLDDLALKEHWGSILASSESDELFAELHGPADSRSVTQFLAFDARNPGSILSCILSARENARMIRGQISSEMWQVINELYLFLKERSAERVWSDGPYEFFHQVRTYSHLFQGLTDSTYPRGEGWDYILFGRLLERADKTTRILDMKYHILLPAATDVGGAVDTAQWQAILRSASALEAYRRSSVQEIIPWRVAEFLIFSPSFPRSVAGCVAELESVLARILVANPGHPPAARDAAHELLTTLRSLTIDAVLRGGLHEFLIGVQRVLGRIGAEVVHAAGTSGTEAFQQQQQQQ
jgi:uncharacterized alpha-E superfamily protein